MSALSQPIAFKPLYQQRVWGGRTLETQYGRKLPDDGQPYGESWEVVDRPQELSVVNNGVLKGETLHNLWTGPEREVIFGPGLPDNVQFPVLCKILDARERLSIQVHPPADVAPSLGGEPKTEMWYIAHAEPDAVLYVGLKQGVTRESFEASLKDGTAEGQVHQIPVKTGDSLFIPSGRLHAIGAGLLIFEIQQNSDTTYRVFDWNRVGLDGQPRELHIEESLKCIDFEDVEPELKPADSQVLATCEYFHVERHPLGGEGEAPSLKNPKGRFAIYSVTRGEVKCGKYTYKTGAFFLIPAAGSDELSVVPVEGGTAEVLQTTLPVQG